MELRYFKGKRGGAVSCAVSLLLAAALAVGFVPWGKAGDAWAAEMAGEAADAPRVALTVLVEGEAPLVNGAFDLAEDATVADLLAAAGFTAGDQEASAANPLVYFDSYGYPNFLGCGWDPATGAYWGDFFDGAADMTGATALAAAVVDGGHYQYLYSATATSFEYTVDMPDPLAGQGPEGPGDTEWNVCAYDAAKAKALLTNLSMRFAAGGSDGELYVDDNIAAIALNLQGYGASIDAASLKQAVLDDGEWLSAGLLAKYILCLTAAGEDCTAVEIGGVQRNLLDEMEAFITPETGVYEAVWIALAYRFGGYETAHSAAIEAQMAQAIIASQGASGLFGEPWPDTQTTAQGVFALMVVAPGESVAINAALEAIRAQQNGDGGFASGWSDGSDLDSTAAVCIALDACGIDPAGEAFMTENGSTPLGFVVSKADANLCGFQNASAANEQMTAATAAWALAWHGIQPADFTYVEPTGAQIDPRQGPQGEDDPEGEPGAAPQTGDGNAPVLALALLAAFLGLAVAATAAVRSRRQRD